jgi:hypothetical protein
MLFSLYPKSLGGSHSLEKWLFAAFLTEVIESSAAAFPESKIV